MPPETPHQAAPDTANSPNTTSEGRLLAPPAGDSAPQFARGEPAQDVADVALIAEAIRRAGMAAPASIALGIAGPLAWIGGQLLWAVQPLVQGLRVGPGGGARGADAGAAGIVPRLARFLEAEGNVAALVAHLETTSEPTSPRRKRWRHSIGRDNEPL